ncbi:hypothetical protein GCM10025734_78200 [Kitasatospora paranensis]
MAGRRRAGRTGSAGSSRGGFRVPVLVNLALGILAIIPLGLGRWLVTEWLPMGCHSVTDLASAPVDCDYTTLDHAPVVMGLLAVTGVPLAIAVLLADVVLPLRRGRRLGPWLGTAAVLLPAPFVVLLALAGW